MTPFTRELFLKALDEWSTFPDAFRGLSPKDQKEFLDTQGYASLRDLLAHVAVWWEEARGIVAEAVKQGEKTSRKYDFAEFNAAAVKRFQDTAEANFLVWYEAERQRMLRLVSGLTEAQFGIRRIQRWLDGVILLHLKEHGIGAPRFLIIDMLQREWGDYIAEYNGLDAGRQRLFVQKQGYERFRDVLAHVIAWWEQGISVIESASAEDPCNIEDVDAFNARAIERFRPLEDQQVLTQYENTRLTLSNLVDMLPEDVLGRPNVQSWLRADVIEHYFEHAP